MSYVILGYILVTVGSWLGSLFTVIRENWKEGPVGLLSVGIVWGFAALIIQILTMWF